MTNDLRGPLDFDVLVMEARRVVMSNPTREDLDAFVLGREEQALAALLVVRCLSPAAAPPLVMQTLLVIAGEALLGLHQKNARKTREWRALRDKIAALNGKLRDANRQITRMQGRIDKLVDKIVHISQIIRG